jgi:hypothetical protein
MRRTFIETTSFSRRVDRAGSAALRDVQAQIMKDPDAGKLMPGTGGLRKLRMPDPGRGKGKRGGIRVVYLDLADRNRTYLLALYDKDAQDDLSQEEKKTLKALVAQLKAEG